jgi:hypothetical protein
MDEFLAFVKKIGNTLDGQNIYEFMFTTVPDVVWGDNFNIIPAGIIPNLIPEKNCLSRKGRVLTDIDFHLACESTCFSMMDCIDNIISLCFTEAGIDNEFKFDFGEEFNIVLDRLKKYGLELVELEEIKLDGEEDIIDSVVKELEGEKDDNGEGDDLDDIW